MVIIKVEITPMPTNFTDPMPSVIATFEDESTKTLFSFYPDEISFSEGDFIGLTETEAHQLKSNKDRAYIRQP